MLRLTILAAILGVGCYATPFYIPESACPNMRPGIVEIDNDYFGHIAAAQTEAAPYTFTYQYDEEELAYRVVLSGVDGATFRGFFLRAVDPLGLDSGIFYYDFEDEDKQPVSCDSLYDSVSHTDGEDKTMVTVFWIGAYEPLMLATVVKDTQTFWVRLEGTEITSTSN